MTVKFIFIFLLNFSELKYLNSESDGDFNWRTKEQLRKKNVETADLLWIDCLGICDPTQPSKDVNLQARCEQHFCDEHRGDFEWEFIPKLKKGSAVFYGFLNGLAKIKGGSYSWGKNFQVRVFKDKQVSSTISISYRKAPFIKIGCLENCALFESSKQIQLVAQCTDNCGENRQDELNTTLETGNRAAKKLTYAWTIYPPSARPLSYAGKSQETLIIPAMSFEGSKRVTVKAVGKGGSGTYDFTTFSPDCTIIPPMGFTETEFSFDCQYDSGTEAQVFRKKGKEQIIIFDGSMTGKPIYLEKGNPVNLTIKIPSARHEFFVQVIVKLKEDLQTIQEQIFGKREDSLTSLLDKKLYREALSHAMGISSDLQNISNSQQREAQLLEVASLIFKNASNMEVMQMLDYVKTVCNQHKVNAETMRILSETVLNAARRVNTNTTLISGDVHRESDQVYDTLSCLLNQIGKKKVGQVSGSEEDYPLYVDMEPYRFQQLKNLELATNTIMESADIIALTVDPLDFELSRQVSSSEINETMIWLKGPGVFYSGKEKNSSFVEVSKSLSDRLGTTQNIVLLSITKFHSNPYNWHPFGQKINTAVLRVNIFTFTRNITDLGAAIDLHLKITKKVVPAKINGVLKNKLWWRVHKVFMQSNTTLIVNFYVDPKGGTEYYGYTSHYFPTKEEVQNKGKLMKKRGANHMKILQQKNGSVLYVSVARQVGKRLKYKIFLTEVGCWHWDGKKFGNDHCIAGDEIPEEYLLCRCTHLTLFAGVMAAPRHREATYITETMGTGLQMSFLVTWTVFFVTLVWIIIMAWAAVHDARLRHRKVRKPKDSIPGDSFPYLVIVLTGQWQGAACTAHVALQLLGTESDSRVHLLDGEQTRLPGCQDLYVIHTPAQLGSVTAVRIFHDSYGSSPHWYLESVEVRDMVNKKKYWFLSRSWLSLIWGDGQVDRVLIVTEKKIRPAHKLLPALACAKIRDEHLWLGIAARSEDSTFSSKERTAVAASVMFLALTLGAVMGGVNSEYNLDPRGSVNFQLNDFKNMGFTLLSVFTYGLTMSLLFRRSMPADYY